MDKEINNYIDNIPWDLKDVINFVLFLILYMCLTYINLKYHQNIYYFIMLDIPSLLFCMLILKKILKKYKNGWDILIKKERNLKKLIPIAIFIGTTLAIIHLIYISLIMPNTFSEPMITESFLILLFYGIAIAPFTEELWYRSFIYRGIKKQYGTMIAIIYSIILFFLAHIFYFSFFPLLIFSIAITAFYEKTRALYNTMLIHSTYNFVLFMLEQFF